MIEWADQGLVLSVRPHGENAAIAVLFTEGHGRHAGVVRGGTGRRLRPVLQPGNLVAVAWKARLDDHMGSFTVEPLHSGAALLADRAGLAGLGATAGLLLFSLPEREPHPALFARTRALLSQIEAGEWFADYARWELHLLSALGYGLDLGRCAVTGGAEDLAYISPRTGRAVSRGAAGEWAERLLPLSPVLLADGPGRAAETLIALRATGYFLNRLAADLGNRPLPASRERLLEALERAGG